MRQLCNASYAALVEWADEKEKEKIDRQLEADDPGAVSYGTMPLLALMSVGGARR